MEKLIQEDANKFLKGSQCHERERETMVGKRKYSSAALSTAISKTGRC